MKPNEKKSVKYNLLKVYCVRFHSKLLVIQDNYYIH